MKTRPTAMITMMTATTMTTTMMATMTTATMMIMTIMAGEGMMMVMMVMIVLVIMMMMMLAVHFCKSVLFVVKVSHMFNARTGSASLCVSKVEGKKMCRTRWGGGGREEKK